MDGAQRVRLRFLPDGTEVRVPSGTPIFDAASWNGIAIDSTCGGHGTCKKCKVRFDEGDVPVSPSTRARSARTSCATAGGSRAARRRARTSWSHVPPLQTRPKAALVGVGRHVILRPAVQKRYVVLEEPTLEDQRSDVAARARRRSTTSSRASSSTSCASSAASCARRTSTSPRWSCDEVLIDVEPGDTTTRRFAIAFDLGTTTVVATLLDLETGQPAAVRSMLNRQQPYGADVISRISATMLDDDALGALEARAHETLAAARRARCARRPASRPTRSTRSPSSAT